MRRGIAPIGLILATGLALLFLLPGSVSSGMASSLSVAATSAPPASPGSTVSRRTSTSADDAQRDANRTDGALRPPGRGRLPCSKLRTAGLTAQRYPATSKLPRTMGIPASPRCASDPTFAGYTTSWTCWDGEFCTYLNPHEDWFLHNAAASGSTARAAGTT